MCPAPGSWEKKFAALSGYSLRKLRTTPLLPGSKIGSSSNTAGRAIPLRWAGASAPLPLSQFPQIYNANLPHPHHRGPAPAAYPVINHPLPHAASHPGRHGVVLWSQFATLFVKKLPRGYRAWLPRRIDGRMAAFPGFGKSTGARVCRNMTGKRPCRSRKNRSIIDSTHDAHDYSPLSCSAARNSARWAPCRRRTAIARM